ncbi:BPSS1780 family membrane protein [Candidatus Thiothrix sp. Deng01]|uniref:BPSS1780 family membrane protein n=1 Tax=Candidatus Thiothrix phosphatis TaxID=3112415 RepID=A0ABU6CVV8_9GAMM|nr:BPSS1780 family membrane protein [Candidatus Thiothrix sp. Deng01]MEB4590964.1 BPSS1780 family membrane protein [Candidatus Thiothrix sp. Deng01]
MSVKNIPASRAVDWYKAGWGIFSKDMVTWVLMALIGGVGAIVLSVLPIIGQIILLLIMPALVAGMLYAAQQSKAGNPVKLEHLWSVLVNPQKRNQFLLLGGVMFAAAIVIAIISAAFIGDNLLRGATVGVGGFGVGGMAFMLLVGFASFIVFNYTPALMLFRGMPVMEALKTCVSTAVTQIAPLLVLFLIYAVLGIIGSIPFGLGLLVVMPVTVGAIYVSYEELFA